MAEMMSHMTPVMRASPMGLHKGVVKQEALTMRHGPDDHIITKLILMIT